MNCHHRKEFLSRLLSVSWLRKFHSVEPTISTVHNRLHLDCTQRQLIHSSSLYPVSYCSVDMWIVICMFHTTLNLFPPPNNVSIWNKLQWTHSSSAAWRIQTWTVVHLSLLFYVMLLFMCVPQGLLLIVPSFICVGLASSPMLLYIGLLLFAICKCER